MEVTSLLLDFPISPSSATHSQKKRPRWAEIYLSHVTQPLNDLYVVTEEVFRSPPYLCERLHIPVTDIFFYFALKYNS